MNEDRVIGTARNLGGQAQEGLGRMTGDTKSQVEGVINQAAGAAQNLYGQAKEGAADAAQAVRRSAMDAEDIVRQTIEKPPLSWRCASVGSSAAWDAAIECGRDAAWSAGSKRIHIHSTGERQWVKVYCSG